MAVRVGGNQLRPMALFGIFCQKFYNSMDDLWLSNMKVECLQPGLLLRSAYSAVKCNLPVGIARHVD